MKNKNQSDKYSLIAQATYHEIQFGLYKDKELIEKNTVIKTEAASLLMDQLNKLLEKHNLSWKNIELIGVNQGPAPFTTLRALITTMNGISFATGIPLVGVDGLTSFAAEQSGNQITVVLLNAFGQDVYFAIKNGDTIKTGWQNGTTFLEKLKETVPDKIKFIGNGVDLFHEQIKTLFRKGAEIPTPCPEYVSLETVATQTFKQKEKVSHLTPLYLKTQQYKPA